MLKDILSEAAQMQITVAELVEITGLSVDSAARWIEPLRVAGERGSINSKLRTAMFLAQCAHESLGFKALVENLNYTPAALLGKWPKRFTSGQSNAYGRTSRQAANQEMIAIIAYGGRGGNNPNPSKDGWTYRGRGLIQVTLKENYQGYGLWSGTNALDKPELLEQPKDAALSAAWYFVKHDLNRWADRGDVTTVSRLINCGPNSSVSAIPHGLDARRALYQKALKVLK